MGVEVDINDRCLQVDSCQDQRLNPVETVATADYLKQGGIQGWTTDVLMASDNDGTKMKQSGSEQTNHTETRRLQQKLIESPGSNNER